MDAITFLISGLSILLHGIIALLSLVYMHNIHPGANIHPGCKFAPGVYFGHIYGVL